MKLVGRKSVIGTLDAALADCVAGRSRIVWIEGAAGCGKSALADALVESAAEAGATVLSAVASPDERAVPLGVVRQLLHGEQLFALPRPAGGNGTPSWAEALRVFCTEVRELSLDAPVVVCIDDVQHADVESLHYVQYLARHARSAAVLVVLTGSAHAETLDAVFTTEVMRQPHFRRVRLSLLTADEAAAVLGGEADPLCTELHRISGGNPLLMRALAEERDHRPAPAEPFAPEPGGPYAQALTTCLHRTGPVALGMARALALLGEQGSVERAARLLEIDLPTARRAVAALEAAGLLKDARFPHPGATGAVLEDAGAVLRGEMHRRAAQVLREDAGPATAVAAHLLASADEGATAVPPVTPHEVEVLREAAEELLTRDDARGAARLLELALHACEEMGAGGTEQDRAQRAGLRLRMARLTARFDPTAAERQLTALLDPRSPDRPAPEQIQQLAGLLLTQGRVAEAEELASGTESPGASPLDTVLDSPAAVSERLLQSARLTDATLTPLARAVRSLVCSDHPERAVPWSRRLLEEAQRAEAPGWTALFATLYAEALLRLGDLRGARTYATAALEALPEKNGIFPCGPTAVLIRACTAMGQYTEASRLADRQVSPRLLATLPGLSYLRARGVYHLAVNQPHAALADFLETGRLLESWNIDRPAFLPWRTDAAEALLRLGEDRQAEQLVLQQLALPDARRPWVRGISLRLRAMTGEPKWRITTLGQAIDELHRSGDRLEAARAMAELGRALQADGAPAKGSAMIRTAWNLAKDTEATALCKEILPDAPLTPERTVPAPAEGETRTKLSSSEQRVATLAAQGLTNREISAKLYLTVSTVEQHLTRVYRKLQISSRGELPLGLERDHSAPLR